jgi:hypothetical protein
MKNNGFVVQAADSFSKKKSSGLWFEKYSTMSSLTTSLQAKGDDPQCLADEADYC